MNGLNVDEKLQILKQVGSQAYIQYALLMFVAYVINMPVIEQDFNSCVRNKSLIFEKVWRWRYYNKVAMANIFKHEFQSFKNRNLENNCFNYSPFP